MNSGQKLWKRAKEIIPSGNMLLSKNPDMFLPGVWPAYFKKAKGCEVWDLDNNKFLDFAYMGIGTSILGYAHDAVDKAVIDSIRNGNVSTLNCPEEVALAEKLIDLHPWAGMVRLARSGGEANAIAVRIARSASGRDGVAFCGYHGWHDWYLAANLGDKTRLDEHLLDGLSPAGVPKHLSDSVFPFKYNSIDELRTIVKNHDIGTVIMEVMRNEEPYDGFLLEVRKLADEHKLVLIFDECTSGFRETYGGFHKKFDVNPDIAVFGKALGNGFAITAVIGKTEIMESMQNSFVSSTFWTERSGPVAALATLEVMKRERSWEVITEIGREIKKVWSDTASSNNIAIDIFGIAPLAKFKFKSGPHQVYKTYLTQEFLKRGILASDGLYASICHDEKIVSRYEKILQEIFASIAGFEESGNVDGILDGNVCQSGFRRLN